MQDSFKMIDIRLQHYTSLYWRKSNIFLRDTQSLQPICRILGSFISIAGCPEWNSVAPGHWATVILTPWTESCNFISFPSIKDTIQYNTIQLLLSCHGYYWSKPHYKLIKVHSSRSPLMKGILSVGRGFIWESDSSNPSILIKNREKWQTRK